jgi:hypothetical protein
MVLDAVRRLDVCKDLGWDEIVGIPTEKDPHKVFVTLHDPEIVSADQHLPL